MILWVALFSCSKSLSFAPMMSASIGVHPSSISIMADSRLVGNTTEAELTPPDSPIVLALPGRIAPHPPAFKQWSIRSVYGDSPAQLSLADAVGPLLSLRDACLIVTPRRLNGL
jgi:hypothetical protein